MDTDPATIASKLNRGQKSTIRCLDDTPSVLGCAEPTALRLSRATTRRPALTYYTQGASWKMFALTPIGLEVQEHCS
jgi:hypothetical protein